MTAVCVLVYDHRHGTDVSLHASPELAQQAIAEIARQWWDEEWNGDWDAPEDPDELSDAEVTRVYFGNVGDEHWTTTELEITEPPVAAIAELVSYNWRDEEDDYAGNCSDEPDGNQRSGHIFEQLMRIQAWLEAEHGYPHVEPRKTERKS